MLKVTPHRCHPEKRAVGERAVGKQARKYCLIFQDVTAKYCIYDKVPSLPMPFFVRIKGCVNFHETIPAHKKRAELFSHLELFLKMTASLSNLILLLAFIIGLI